MCNCRYSPIDSTMKNGHEKITGINNLTLLDFWKWAYSDVMGNSERGIFAEWLVSNALDCVGNVRIEWDNYDLITAEGIKIEVKTSGYLQTWGQKKLSKLSFSIKETYGWNKKTNEYDDEKKRQSDIYVFCVHKHTEQETVNPLDITQWDFYVIDTNTLNQSVGSQRSITISKLIKIGAVLTEYNSLKETINNLYENIK